MIIYNNNVLLKINEYFNIIHNTIIKHNVLLITSYYYFKNIYNPKYDGIANKKVITDCFISKS